MSERHTLGWKDDEVCELLCDGQPAGTIWIYDFAACERCGARLKLRQVNEILEEPRSSPEEAP